MRTTLFLVALVAITALPAYAQLGPAGVPGAPGLAPPPAPAAPAIRQTPESKAEAAPKVPAACAKSKDIPKCISRQEARQKAKTACKGKIDEEYKQCISNYMSRTKK